MPTQPTIESLQATIADLQEELTLTRQRLEHHEKHKRDSDDLLKIILPIGIALSSERDFDRLVENILSEARQLCNADGGTLYIRQDDALRFAIMQTQSLNLMLGGTSGEPIPFEPLPLYDENGKPNRYNVATSAALDGKSINVANVYEQSDKFDFSRTRSFDTSNRYRTVSALTVPLKNNQGDLIGVLQLLNAQDPATGEIIPFDAEMQYVIESLASLAAVALENHILLQEQAYMTAVKRDLDIGRNIQQTFLPDSLPELEGWQIGARFKPAREVSGDFYDAFVLAHHRVGVVIADVSDKGVASALVMALVRTLIRAFSEQIPYEIENLDEEYLQALTRTNNYLMDHHKQSFYFTTAFFGILNLETCSLMYINAGHYPPLLLSAEGGIRTKLAPTGPALGMMTGVHFDIRQIEIQPGDTLFCFTDGVSDARNRDEKFFGEKRLLDLLQKPGHSVDELLHRVFSAVQSHIGETPQFDDITMLALRRVE